MINFHINSTEVTNLVNSTGQDRYTAMAILAGKQFGITPQEEAEYMRIFHKNMADRKGVLTSINNALVEIAMNDNFIRETVAKCVAPQPEPLQSFYQFSLN